MNGNVSQFALLDFQVFLPDKLLSVVWSSSTAANATIYLQLTHKEFLVLVERKIKGNFLGIF